MVILRRYKTMAMLTLLSELATFGLADEKEY